jgi:hypothetical protein
MVDGLSKGNKGWTTHTHTHEIFFEATKNEKMHIYIYIYITFFLLQQCRKQKKAMVEREVCQSFLSSNNNVGGLL